MLSLSLSALSQGRGLGLATDTVTATSSARHLPSTLHTHTALLFWREAAPQGPLDHIIPNPGPLTAHSSASLYGLMSVTSVSPGDHSSVPAGTAGLTAYL